MDLMEKLAEAAAQGIDWQEFATTAHLMCARRGLSHSEFVVGQLLTALVALFDDGRLTTPEQRREVWDSLTTTAFAIVAKADANGLLKVTGDQPPV